MIIKCYIFDSSQCFYTLLEKHNFTLDIETFKVAAKA
ncbi:hypothetical protein HC248_01805 [Polaromonas vacuolata]|uniref:Uncharacterized protein n=1 Tax=Polaromonas vacuolata TaxID=37448 RepID=A0A6H2H9F1_9BURK|nr:hypothetical protein HC248_01805 [Polaromonas vacuolata]